MATSQEYADIHAMLGEYESTMQEAGDELMLLLSRMPDITGDERDELLRIHQRLVQPKAELDRTAEIFARRAARWPLIADAQLDETLGRIKEVMG